MFFLFFRSSIPPSFSQFVSLTFLISFIFSFIIDYLILLFPFYFLLSFFLSLLSFFQYTYLLIAKCGESVDPWIVSSIGWHVLPCSAPSWSRWGAGAYWLEQVMYKMITTRTVQMIATLPTTMAAIQPGWRVVAEALSSSSEPRTAFREFCPWSEGTCSGVSLSMYPEKRAWDNCNAITAAAASKYSRPVLQV